MSFEEHSISADSRIPLYYQLKKIILSEIESGNIQVGDAIPTELELCQMYGISRSTTRQAISELVYEGRLHRVKSKGTFVSDKGQSRVYTDLSAMYTSYTANVKGLDMTPVMAVSTVELVPAPLDVAEHLHVGEGTPVIQLVRTWMADNVINASISSYLAYPICKHVMERMEREPIQQPSMYAILAEKEETAVGRVIRRISAYNASAKDGRLLNIKPGSAICMVMNLAFSKQTEAPLVYECVKYVGVRNELEISYRLDLDPNNL